MLDALSAAVHACGPREGRLQILKEGARPSPRGGSALRPGAPQPGLLSAYDRSPSRFRRRGLEAFQLEFSFQKMSAPFKNYVLEKTSGLLFALSFPIFCEDR